MVERKSTLLSARLPYPPAFPQQYFELLSEHRESLGEIPFSTQIGFGFFLKELTANQLLWNLGVFFFPPPLPFYESAQNWTVGPKKLLEYESC